MIVHVGLHALFPATNQTGASPFEMALHRNRGEEDTVDEDIVVDGQDEKIAHSISSE
jgi:hypothetical protein